MTNSAASQQVDLSALLDPNPPRQPRKQRHRISWFLDDEVTFELECLHAPVPQGHICDGDLAKEDSYAFLESHDGGREPLRNGTIESWWAGSDEDVEMTWQYVHGSEPAIRKVHDLIEMPDFNWDTQKGRGDWSTRDVSTGAVVLNSEWNKPDCAEHGAMNAVSPDTNIYRCLTCGRACYCPTS